MSVMSASLARMPSDKSSRMRRRNNNDYENKASSDPKAVLLMKTLRHFQYHDIWVQWKEAKECAKRSGIYSKLNHVWETEDLGSSDKLQRFSEWTTCNCCGVITRRDLVNLMRHEYACSALPILKAADTIAVPRIRGGGGGLKIKHEQLHLQNGVVIS